MMHKYFAWNGIRSTAYGVFVSEQPPIMQPKERITFEDIAGKAGSLAITEGEKVYEDVTLTVKCWAKPDGDVLGFLRHIRGAGHIEFANRPEGYYKGRLSKCVELKRFKKSDVRQFTLTFRCEPYIYTKSNEKIILEEAGVVMNHFNEKALPVIDVAGYGDIALYVNGEMVMLTGIPGEITLNSAIEEAYSGKTSMNNHMSGEFPALAPGANVIYWMGNVSSLSITPNWRMT